MKSLLILLLFALLEACHSHATSPDADLADAIPRQVVVHTKQLLAGELAEATLTGGNGDAAQISLAAAVAKLDWNLHGKATSDVHAFATYSAAPHAGDQTIREEFDVMTVDYTFTPAEFADWRLVIRSKDSSPMDVAVTISLHGNMQWTDWK